MLAATDWEKRHPFLIYSHMGPKCKWFNKILHLLLSSRISLTPGTHRALTAWVQPYKLTRSSLRASQRGARWWEAARRGCRAELVGAGSSAALGGRASRRHGVRGSVGPYGSERKGKERGLRKTSDWSPLFEGESRDYEELTEKLEEQNFKRILRTGVCFFSVNPFCCRVIEKKRSVLVNLVDRSCSMHIRTYSFVLVVFVCVSSVFIHHQ
jgi:hypothetical protein